MGIRVTCGFELAGVKNIDIQFARMKQNTRHNETNK